LINISDLKALKPETKNQRLLGIDLGDKTVGLALSDPMWIIASPYRTLVRNGDKQPILEISKIIEEQSVAAIVMGYPINMNGTLGPQSEKVLKFAEKLSQSLDAKVLLWDERLSTVAVTRVMLEADISRKKQKAAVDKMAASYILQGVLNAIS